MRARREVRRWVVPSEQRPGAAQGWDPGLVEDERQLHAVARAESAVEAAERQRNSYAYVRPGARSA